MPLWHWFILNVGGSHGVSPKCHILETDFRLKQVK
jgi:hypothetical protein